MTIERDVLDRAAHRMKLHVVRRARTGLQQQAEETASFVSAVVQHPDVVAVPDEAPTLPIIVQHRIDLPLFTFW